MTDSKNLVLGVCSSIAAVKVPAIISLFKEEGFSIKVVLTPNAVKLLNPSVLYGLKVGGVFWQMFPDDLKCDPSHISLVDWGSVLLIAPITASSLCKLAYGIADNLLLTTALCFDPKKIVVTPAMNWRMWNSKQVQKAVSLLKDMGVILVGPSSGKLACGEEGEGRLAELKQIILSCKEVLSGKAG